ncbi:hypothetical protein NUW58_g9744 [Xylaria curta]|uniref:Uncharacterized protein n=1 Tax=Xylaria curta TaxID=42375 RepID=A0ACC1MV89_9PEZI|nr:hypothetical protein NUW58_g9744 [Xylaria curta]
MTPEIMYTVVFGSLASVIAIATMVQNYLQRQRCTQLRDIEAQAPPHGYRAHGLLATMMLAQVQRPDRAVLRLRKLVLPDASRTQRGRFGSGRPIASIADHASSIPQGNNAAAQRHSVTMDQATSNPLLSPPELSPLEQEVLEEYERLAENMKKVRVPSRPTAQTPSSKSETAHQAYKQGPATSI